MKLRIIIFIMAFVVTPVRAANLYIACIDEQAATKQFPDSENLIYNIIDSYTPENTKGKVHITAEPSGTLNLIFFFDSGDSNQITCKIIEAKPKKIIYVL